MRRPEETYSDGLSDCLGAGGDVERQGDDVEREVCLADRLCQLVIKPMRGKTNLDLFS